MSFLRQLGRRLFTTTTINNDALTRGASKPPNSLPKLGNRLYNFLVFGREQIEELDLTLIKLVHEPTGATHYHLYRDDPNNVFCVAFRTPPSDSTGIPHILEHTVLCSSTKYPVRDPFFKMLNRSLASYMNAWTASEHTAYPFCTSNQEDYANLRDVYCDAVFSPLLSKTDFFQEGWRLEHRDPHNPNSPLHFKGVVYNEMKGALSDGEGLFATRLQQHLFPSTVYGHVSGGDPPNIVDLSHEQMVAFYRKHYHPSNALFYTYGNFPLDQTLQFINSKINSYKKTEEISINMPAGWQDGLKPRIELSCPLDPIGDPERQTKMSLSFLVNDVSIDPQQSFHLKLLSYLLLDGSSSPMYKALIDSNIGQEYSSNVGYDGATKVASFSFGLQGIKYEDVSKVEEIILNVLREASKKGFNKSRIDAALHLLELNTKRQSAQFGLALSHQVISSWVYEMPVESVLQINKQIEKFKEAFAKGDLFESLIGRYFLGNDRRVLFVMKPDESFNSRLAEAEQRLLEEKIKKLQPQDHKKLFETNLKLLKLQETKEDISSLPCLKMEELSRTAKVTLVHEFSLESSPKYYWRSTSSANGIMFLKKLIPIDIQSLSSEDLKFLPLVCESLTELGIKGKTMEQFDQETKMVSGGLKSSLHIGRQLFGLQGSPEVALSVGTLALDRHAPQAINLLTNALKQTDFSNLSRLKTLILSGSSSMMNSIASSGHSYAMTLAASSINARNAIEELTGGLSQAYFLNELTGMEDLSGLVSKMEAMKESILSSPISSWRMAVIQTHENHENLIPHLESFSSSIKTKNCSPNKLETKNLLGEPHKLQPSSNSLLLMPFSTNFCAKVYQFNPHNLKESAHLDLLAKLFRSGYLHREIREKGGAYGGGASYSRLNGLFSLYSYRDPNPLNSLKAFDAVHEWFETYQLNEQDLLEATLSVLSSLDAPVDVSSEGLHMFYYGITDVDRQLYRDQLFAVTPASLKETARSLFNNSRYISRSCVIGEKEKENSLKDALLSDPHWAVVNFNDSY